VTPALLVFLACFAVDGDTIRCDGERIRLARIDAPERGKPGFQAAKDHMALQVRGKEVRCVVRGRERYGRLLAECGTDETPNLSNEMLRAGLADVYRRKR
jgi:micrococcal nuclease